MADRFSSVRSLLNAAPSPALSARLDPLANAQPTGAAATKPARDAKRKAAFDAWHSKKLAELSSQQASAPADKQTKGETPPPGCRLTPSASRQLTAPKLSRHNDAAYYPNIQCILCQEWVCSRNRYMHIESHLQYRPYICSVCGYDNRKEIFITLHIKRTHAGAASVLYKPDADLEHRAWELAEQCLQHTRQILIGSEQCGDRSSSKKRRKASASSLSSSDDSVATNASSQDAQLLAEYSDIFRPKIFNSQRAEKSQLIEESRQKGLIPDFSEVSSREAKCVECGAFVLSHPSVLEEHARIHLSRASYRCNIDGCLAEHHSKNFLNRHMKEVHKYRRAPHDMLQDSASLFDEFAATCLRAFPEALVNIDWAARHRQRAFVDAPHHRRANDSPGPLSGHSNVPPYSCGLRAAESADRSTIELHVRQCHPAELSAGLRVRPDALAQLTGTLAAVYPNVQPQQLLQKGLEIV